MVLEFYDELKYRNKPLLIQLIVTTLKYFYKIKTSVEDCACIYLTDKCLVRIDKF